MRVAPTIVLSPEERVALERWAARPARGDPRAVRARIVLAAAAGAQDLAIAARLRVHRRTVARWRAQFLARRLPALDSHVAVAPRTGLLSDRTVRELLRTGQDTAGEVRPSARSVGRRFGVSHSTVRRVWQRFGVDRRPVASVPLRPDPRFPLSPRAPAGLYLRAQDRGSAFLLSLEPMGTPWTTPTSAAALPASIPSLSRTGAPPASPVRREVRARALLRFLASIDRALGPERVAEVLVFAPGLDLDATLRQWSLRRPNLRLRWLPDERRWRELTLNALAVSGRRSARAGRAHGRGETARSIGRYLASYPVGGPPFEWTATGLELDRDAAGPRLRLELSATGHPGFKQPFRALTDRPPDPRYREMARVVLRRCLGLRAGELVTVDSWSSTLEAANALTLEAWRIGARPMLVLRDEPTYWAAVQETPPDHLARLGAHLRAAIARSDALVTFFGPSDRERFHALPYPTRNRLGLYDDAVFATAERHRVRVAQMALGRVSESSARMYAVDVERWRDEVVDATTVDPRELMRRGARLFQRLRSGREVEITHPNGTRLTLGLRGRRPEVVDGIIPRPRRGGTGSVTTLPAGVVNVALDERVADGFFLSNVANTVGVSDTVGDFVGGRWTFAGGRLTRFAYERGQEMFAQSYERAGPERDRPGVLSVGLNDRIATAPLLMDQGVGTITLQIGRNVHVGGSSRAYWWGWLLLRGGDLRVDGRLCVRGGKLVP
jgi:leucyl aminopeptidase (aminopeptidase T)/transposase